MEMTDRPTGAPRRGRRVALVVAAAVGVAALWTGAHLAGAASPEPGSPEDPLVSRSFVQQYVQQYVPQALQEKLPEAVQKLLQPALQTAGQQTQVAVAQQIQAALDQQAQKNQFVVINLAKGVRLIAQGGTELVLRSGQATVVAGPQGGLADLSAGMDLSQGASVPANHLLLVPRTEGRGLIATTDVILLIKGPYAVQPGVG